MSVVTTHARDAGNRSRTKRDSFHAYQCVDRQERPDPAGLCDGVDYQKELQIRLEYDGSVYISWQDGEQWEGKSVELPYAEFYDAMAKFLPTLRGAK